MNDEQQVAAELVARVDRAYKQCTAIELAMQEAKRQLAKLVDELPGSQRRYHKDGSCCWVGTDCFRAHDLMER